MKKFITSIVMLVLGLFMMGLVNGCVANNAQRGALIGGGLGGIAHAITGGNTEQGLIIAGVASALGYIVGNESDKNITQSIQQTDRSKMTKCRKIITRKWKNGNMIETIKERCEGNKVESGVY